MTNWTLVIHGGSGGMMRDTVSAAEDQGARAGLAAALAGGAAIRCDGGALDAVEAAVRCLEDDPHFNAERVVAPDGAGGWSFNTAGMYRGAVRHGGRPVIAIYGDERG